MPDAALHPPYPAGAALGKTDTSAEAGRHVEKDRARLQRKVLWALREAGWSGLTTEEIAERTGQDYASIQPRTSELRQLGEIEDSGERRPNRTGRRAIVWILTFPTQRTGKG